MVSRILVIEDNPANLELMTYLLQAFGYTTLVAQDGDAGLDIALGEVPDLIVCDLQLPTIDGYEVARRIKREPAMGHVQIVAVTAFAMVGDREKALAAGFDGYIPKPIVPETFVSEIEAFLRAEQRAPTIVRHEVPAASVVPSSHSITQVKRATILAVDNSAANLSFLCSTLEPFGYEVISVDNVSDALTIARKTLPDLIMSDLHMPRANGLDFIGAVQAEARLKSIPFVFITSSVRDENRIKHINTSSLAKVILRPIDPEVLLAEVEDCLRN